MDNHNTNTWPGWETVRVIGRGSYGTVYEIQRDVEGDTEKAALKHLSIPNSEDEIANLQSEGMDDESITKTFRDELADILNEYKLMRRLNDCPNVVHCDDVKYVQKEDGFGWDILIKMELLTPLVSVLRVKDTISEEDVLALGIDLCRALVRCEEYHILHRDIKIQNIFVAENGAYKLGDFGIARAKEKSGSTGTARIGTPDYMAPEVYWGERYDSTADIYSLGMVMYWLLNNRRMPLLPPGNDTPRLQEREEARMRRLKGEKLPPPVNGSDRLKNIVLRCCAHKPKERYANADELLADLCSLKNSWDRRDDSKPKKNHAVLLVCGALALAGLVFGGMKMFMRLAETAAAPEPVSHAVSTPAAELYPSSPTPTAEPTPQPTSTPGPMPTAEPTPRILTEEEQKYADAEALLADGRAGAAALAFRALGSYADAPQRSKDAWKQAIVHNHVCAAEKFSIGVQYDGAAIRTGNSLSFDKNVVAVAAGGTHSVYLYANGRVSASGLNIHGENEVGDWTDIVSIAAGEDHTVGLRSDGTVVAVGDGSFERCDLSDWQDIVAVAAGTMHTVGLKADGTVVAKGLNSNGQCSVSEWKNIVAICAGAWHTIGVRADGTCVAAGWNESGQCDVSSWKDVVSACAGEWHSVGLRADGTCVTAGSNQYGELDLKSWTGIVEVCAGPHHTIGVRSDGTCVAAGYNEFGMCYVQDWSGIGLGSL